MRDYREKTVEGMFTDIRHPLSLMNPCKAKVTVRMTSDKIGKSLSLSCGSIMISIPLESVENIIKVAEGEK